MSKHAGLYYMEDLEELFVDVQHQKIFPDQKTFVDCVPKFPVDEILEQYRTYKLQDGNNLLEFVLSHFNLPVAIAQPAHLSGYSIDEHISYLWNLLSRDANKNGGTLIALPKPSIVPGGRFREVFYWDTYFTMLGLQVAGHLEQLENMIDNFAFLIDTFGHIPNGNRTYFLTRSQPPFFSHMVALLAESKGPEIFVKYLPQLTSEYKFWMKGAALLTPEQTEHEHTVLLNNEWVANRYWDELNTPRVEGYAADLKTHAEASADPSDHYRHVRGACESGWDFSGRWFKDGQNIQSIHTCDFIPVDLNCLLWHLERILADAYTLDSKPQTAETYEESAAQRQAVIETFLWNNEAQVYSDYNFVGQQSSGALTMAMAYPLFCGIASQEHALHVLNRIENDFLQPGGLLTTLTNTGHQWDAPNGWAPLQWIGYIAAIKYKRQDLGSRIAQAWMSNVESIFNKTGKLMEKYNVVDTSIIASGGEYLNQDGFGWTNGVYVKLKDLEKNPAVAGVANNKI